MRARRVAGYVCFFSPLLAAVAGLLWLVAREAAASGHLEAFATILGSAALMVLGSMLLARDADPGGPVHQGWQPKPGPIPENIVPPGGSGATRRRP